MAKGILSQLQNIVERVTTNISTPVQQNNGPGGQISCYHHPTEPAVATCEFCKKGLCRDCYDSYGNSEHVLCFDCAEAMIEEHISDVEYYKAEVQKERNRSVIAKFFLSIWTFIKWTFGRLDLIDRINNSGEPSGCGCLWQVILFIPIPFLILTCPIGIPIYMHSRRKKQDREIAEYEEIIASETAFLRNMRDYFEYSLITQKNVGVDLSTLAAQGSELYENTYAQSVLQNGEKGAQNQLRQGMVQIAANGEIIRSGNIRRK